jgi:hypothetical protein
MKGNREKMTKIGDFTCKIEQKCNNLIINVAFRSFWEFFILKTSENGLKKCDFINKSGHDLIFHRLFINFQPIVIDFNQSSSNFIASLTNFIAFLSIFIAFHRFLPIFYQFFINFYQIAIDFYQIFTDFFLSNFHPFSSIFHHFPSIFTHVNCSCACERAGTAVKPGLTCQNSHKSPKIV